MIGIKITFPLDFEVFHMHFAHCMTQLIVTQHKLTLSEINELTSDKTTGYGENSNGQRFILL